MFSSILHGRRSFELQKWRSLRDKVKFLQNAFASASAADVSLEANTFTSSYLVESLGLTKRMAESVSKRVSLEEKENADSVLNLLRSHGFKDSQISTIISAYPQLLIADAEKSLRPKLQALQSLGASSSELIEIVSKVPKLLEKKVEKSIGLYYGFVKDIMQEGNSSESDKGKLCHSWPQGKPGNKIRNIWVLRELGVPQRLLFPLLISSSQPTCGRERFQETLKKVIDMGFDPTKSKFVEAMHVLYEMSNETLEEKVNTYKRLGFLEKDVWAIFRKWPFFLKFSEQKIIQTFDTLKKFGLVQEEVLSVMKMCPHCLGYSEHRLLDSYETLLGLGFSRDEVKLMIKRFPRCLGYSAEIVKKKFEFVVKEMNWPLESVILIPAVLGYSLEKRTMPRCMVIKALMAKGLIPCGENPPLSSVMACTDQQFLKRYVMKHDKLVPQLMAILSGDR